MEYNWSLEKLISVELFTEIIQDIISWDFSPLEGAGYYRKGEHYGHIELKIYKADKDYTGPVIWNIDNFQIPEEIRDTIRKYINFFYNLVVSIKGRCNLTFEVTNGSFHPVDSGRWGFPNATVYALRNCFDKYFISLNTGHLANIKRLQDIALQQLKHNAATFSQEEILNSLKNQDLNFVIRNILESKNPLMLDFRTNGIPIERKEFTEFVFGNIAEDVVENLKTLDVISGYDEVTDIGFAHIGIILKKEKIFRNLSLRDLNPLCSFYDITFMTKP